MNDAAPSAGDSPASSPLDRAVRRHEPWVFALLLALCVLPVWTVAHFPSNDGPVHVFIAKLLAGDLGRGVYPEYFRLNPSVEPNALVHVLLAGLVRVFGPWTGEKVLVSLQAVAFALAGRHALKAAVPDGGRLLGLLFVPMAFNFFLHMGFYNFSFSTALYLLALGTWYPRRDAPTVGTTLGLAAFGLLLVTTHLMGFVMLLLTIGVVTTADHARRAWAAGGVGLARLSTYLGRAALLLLVFTPGFLLLLSFFLRHGVERAAGDFAAPGKLQLLKALAGFSYLLSFNPVEVGLIAPLALLIAGLGLLRLWGRARTFRLEPADAWLAALLVTLGIYFFVPVTTKEVAVAERLTPFILFLAVLWLAPAARRRHAPAAVLAAVLVTTLGTTGFRLWHYRAFNRALAAYTEPASRVAPGSVVMPLHFWRQTDPVAGRMLSWRANPLFYAHVILATDRDGLSLVNPLMSPAVFGYFPVIFKAERDPFARIVRDEDGSFLYPEFLDYERCTDGRIDDVLTFGAASDPRAAPLAGRLRAGFAPAYRGDVPPELRLLRRTAGLTRNAPVPPVSRCASGGAAPGG